MTPSHGWWMGYGIGFTSSAPPLTTFDWRAVVLRPSDVFLFVCFFSPQILNPQLMIYHPLIKHGLNIHEWIVNRCFLSMKSLEIIYKRMIWYGFNGILMRILMVNKWMTNQSIYGGCTSQPYLMTARLMGFTSMAFLWYESGITGRKRLKITITHIQFI